MSLRVPDPPYASVAALHNSLKALAERGQFGARPQRKSRGEQLSATLPHQVFVLGLADAADGAIERAKPTGWRYLLEADEEVVASGETRLEGDGGHAFVADQPGPLRARHGACPGGRGGSRKRARARARARVRGPPCSRAVPHERLAAAERRRAGGQHVHPDRAGAVGFEPDQVYTAEAFSTRVTELARAVPPTARAGHRRRLSLRAPRRWAPRRLPRGRGHDRARRELFLHGGEVRVLVRAGRRDDERVVRRPTPWAART